MISTFLRALGSCVGLVVAFAAPAWAETIVLYGNDFETPNLPLSATCSTLDPAGINVQHGTAEFVFNQVNTVETLIVEATNTDMTRIYADPEMKGGKYTLGMLSDVQDDRLSLTFDAKRLPFLNVGMDLSAIQVPGCGGPFGIVLPKMKMSLLDSPGGVFDWGQRVLGEQTLEGVMPADPFAFSWKRVVAALDASMSTDGHVSLVFDLTAGGYAAFDNLSITASTSASVIDSDLDGKTDDADNCRAVKNADQANQDSDKAGDVCDPAPADPAVCGDQDGDGKDDCVCDGECPPDGGATLDAAPMDAPGGGDAGGAGIRRRSGGCNCAVIDRGPVGLSLGTSVLLAIGMLALGRSRSRKR